MMASPGDEARVPSELRTDRLYLRAWRPTDAILLDPVLQSNTAHLANWIPAHVWVPAPVPDLIARLAGYAEDFHTGRSCRYAVFSEDGCDLLGEISLFPRSATGRVTFDQADRLEIGYWLRQDVTGRGYATEGARAMLTLAAGIPGMLHVEIRCDSRNVRSAAVPQRLGFELTVPAPTDDPSAQSQDMVWVYDLHRARRTVRTSRKK